MTTNYRQNRAKGLCGLCGKKKPVSGYTLCRHCGEKRREWRRNTYAAKKEKGVCAHLVCNKPATDGRVYCFEHRRAAAANTAKTRTERKAKGLCPMCCEDVVPDDGYVLCKKHRAYMRAASAAYRQRKEKQE